MRAFLKNNRQAPRKVRLVARSVIGKNVAAAISELSFMPQKAAPTLKKIILSAAANARQTNDAIKNEDLIVKNIRVDKGTVYVRYMPRAFGRATPIHRENSHIRVELVPVGGEVTSTPVTEDKKEAKEEVKDSSEKADEKPAKKAVAKKTTTAKKKTVTKKKTTAKKQTNSASAEALADKKKTDTKNNKK
jgi:large subunit ribosomal protein L22